MKKRPRNLISRYLLVVCWGRACLLPSHPLCVLPPSFVRQSPPVRRSERGAPSPPPLTDAPAAFISVLCIWQRSGLSAPTRPLQEGLSNRSPIRCSTPLEGHRFSQRTHFNHCFLSLLHFAG
ncbi:hypothetical protein CEXT_199211 [Caerostris extrusa]|uniref:Secreted protein n=1 Tax=Caerostris extrusa TaxID=172846 RepID=A0AAV4WU66_CAEEX|nr:hypothetical protein CEXT_199211 [Caerostris extrusa]